MSLVYGNALQFNGTSQIAKRAVVSTVVDNFTLCAWAKIDADASQDGVIASNGIDDGVSQFNGYSISVRLTGAWYATLNGVAFVIGNTTVSAATWYLFALVRNAGTSRLYLNGVDENITVATAPNAPTGFTTIGSAVNSSGTFTAIKALKGQVDDGRLYERALTPTELLNLYTRANHPKQADISNANLKAWYKLDESSGTTAADSSGNSLDMTTDPSPSWVTGIVATSIIRDFSSNRSLANRNLASSRQLASTRNFV